MYKNCSIHQFPCSSFRVLFLARHHHGTVRSECLVSSMNLMIVLFFLVCSFADLYSALGFSVSPLTFYQENSNPGISAPIFFPGAVFSLLYQLGVVLDSVSSGELPVFHCYLFFKFCAKRWCNNILFPALNWVKHLELQTLLNLVASCSHVEMLF